MKYLLPKTLPLFIAALLLLAACSQDQQTARGDAAMGEKIFNGEVVLNGGNTPACSSCHTATVGKQPAMGLNMSNVGNRAATRVPGQTAEEYLRTSIVNPDAYLAGGFQEGIMYRDYAKDLSAQQLDDLVAYLLSLRSGQD